MSRINIPIEAITSRLNLGQRLDSIRNQSVSTRFANIKPIGDFFDLKRLSKPANFGEVQSRVNFNLGHFSSNYAIVFVILALYALITNPWLLFLIFFICGGMFGIGKLNGSDLEIGTLRATSSQLYVGLFCIGVPLFFFASVFSTFLWLIGANGVVILGHASFMDKPIESAFSEEAV